MKVRIKDIRTLICNNIKVIENYFFMTVLQILNSLFFLLVYPLLIERLGAESYGNYIFAMSIIAYFITLVNFGFDMPATKYVAQHSNDNRAKTYVLSSVFTAKIYIEMVVIVIFFILVLSIPLLRSKLLLLTLCLPQTLTTIFFPQWYFQGIQKVRIVTFIQLGFKLITIPFILIFINSPSDTYKLAVIFSASSVLGGLVALFIIHKIHNIQLKWMSFSVVLSWFKDVLPFFWSNVLNSIKQQGTFVIIGAFFSMKDVALYDLANKIFSIPSTFTASINGALFPKIVLSRNKFMIRRIIKMEFLLGVCVVLFLLLLGKPIIRILGGEDMMQAYPLLVALSFSIFTILSVGAILSFILVPAGDYKYIAYNQLIAVVGFVLFLALGLILHKQVIIIPLAIAFSSFLELFYCYFLLKKKNV